MNNESSSRHAKILHVAQTAHGGVGSYLEETLAIQVRRHGASSVRMVLPMEHAKFFPGLAEECLLPYRSGGGRIGSSIRMATAAMTAVRQWKPDVVHLHATFAGAVMRPLLALVRHGPKVVYCAHGWAFERRKINPLMTLSMAVTERCLSHLCSAIVCVSRHEAQRARAAGIAQSRLRIVHSGLADVPPSIQGESEVSWPQDRVRVLFVGRLDHEKGVDVLLSAMKLLGDKAFAVVVGAAVVGGYSWELEQPENVRFVGWLDRTQIVPLYQSADVLVVPSRYEAFGLTALEAMRAGLPVVASRVGGLPELVTDHVTGRLFDPGDAVELAKAVDSMDRPVRALMGSHARQRFLRAFRIERVAEELDGVYRSAMQAANPATGTATATAPVKVRRPGI
jgi:glycosyltransferase involved in cell wall biosynthesis